MGLIFTNSLMTVTLLHINLHVFLLIFFSKVVKIFSFALFPNTRQENAQITCCESKDEESVVTTEAFQPFYVFNVT